MKNISAPNFMKDTQGVDINPTGTEHACANPNCKFYNHLVKEGAHVITLPECSPMKTNYLEGSALHLMNSPVGMTTKNIYRHTLKVYIDEYSYNYIILCDLCKKSIEDTLKQCTEKERKEVWSAMGGWIN